MKMDTYHYGCLLDRYNGVQHTASYNDDLRHKKETALLPKLNAS